MKWMKWIGILAVLVAIGLAASGCGGSDDGGGDGLEGTWKATSLNGVPIPAGYTATITLSGNGTYTGTFLEEGLTVTEVGTWSASGNTLTTTFEGETETVTYTLSGNTLILSSSDGVFIMARQ
jgi:heat shock protein HslJ